MSAVGLYAVLARDPMDFLDMIMEEQNLEVLKDLYLMLTLHQPNLELSQQRLNDSGKSAVKLELERRGVPLPEVPASYDHSTYKTRGVPVDQLSLNEARDEVCRLTDVLLAVGEKLSGPADILNDWRLGRAPRASSEYMGDRPSSQVQSEKHAT